MFDFIVKSSQKRILQRAERALEAQSSKVEICSHDNGDYTLLVDGHLFHVAALFVTEDVECLVLEFVAAGGGSGGQESGQCKCEFHI